MLAVNVVGALSGDVAFARPLLPMFVVLAVLVVAVLPYALAGGRPLLLRVALRRPVGGWYLSALNVVVLAVLVAVLLVKPGHRRPDCVRATALRCVVERAVTR